jgi:predicted RNase H-like HicB family nuclease
MKSIIHFLVRTEEGMYIAEGADLAIVTHATTLDELVKNIEEAVSLHFEGEASEAFSFTAKPSVPHYA